MYDNVGIMVGMQEGVLDGIGVGMLVGTLVGDPIGIEEADGVDKVFNPEKFSLISLCKNDCERIESLSEAHPPMSSPRTTTRRDGKCMNIRPKISI